MKKKSLAYKLQNLQVAPVAVIGFHAPINATGRRESKFRLGKRGISILCTFNGFGGMGKNVLVEKNWFLGAKIGENGVFVVGPKNP